MPVSKIKQSSQIKPKTATTATGPLTGDQVDNFMKGGAAGQKQLKALLRTQYSSTSSFPTSGVNFTDLPPALMNQMANSDSFEPLGNGLYLFESPKPNGHDLSLFYKDGTSLLKGSYVEPANDQAASITWE